jgi:hypothetical protein
VYLETQKKIQKLNQINPGIKYIALSRKEIQDNISLTNKNECMLNPQGPSIAQSQPMNLEPCLFLLRGS